MNPNKTLILWVHSPSGKRRIWQCDSNAARKCLIFLDCTNVLMTWIPARIHILISGSLWAGDWDREQLAAGGGSSLLQEQRAGGQQQQEDAPQAGQSERRAGLMGACVFVFVQILNRKGKTIEMQVYFHEQTSVVLIKLTENGTWERHFVFCERGQIGCPSKGKTLELEEPWEETLTETSSWTGANSARMKYSSLKWIKVTGIKSVGMCGARISSSPRTTENSQRAHTE